MGKKIDIGYELDRFYDFDVPGYIKGAGRSFIKIATSDVFDNAKVLKVTIQDVAKYYAYEACNISSGCRTLAGLVGDWRGIDRMAKECLEWFKFQNKDAMRKAGRALGLEPRF